MISIDILKKRLIVAENRLMDDYFINDKEIESNLNNFSRISNFIEQRKSKEFVDKCTYSNQMNSLDRAILEKNVNMSTNNEYSFSAGPMVSSDGNQKNVQSGIATQLTVELFPKKFNKIYQEYPKNETIQRKNTQIGSIDSAVNNHIADAESIVNSCIEEIGLGNINSMYSLAEMLNEVLDQQINLSSLHYEEIESIILSYRKIDDFGILPLYQEIVEQ